jgi:hypothetical protein
VPLAFFNRRDPWWEVDGPAARRERRRHRVISISAFVASLTAVSLATLVWAMHLGIAGAFALHLHVG